MIAYSEKKKNMEQLKDGMDSSRVDADTFVLESMKQEYSYGIFMPKPQCL